MFISRCEPAQSDGRATSQVPHWGCRIHWDRELTGAVVEVVDDCAHSSGVNGLKQTVTPLLTSHSSSTAVVEVVAGTEVAGTVVGDVVGEVEVGTVVGAVVVGTVVVGTVVVRTVVGAVVVGTVVEVVAVVVGEVEVGTVVVGDSSSHSSGVNGLKQTVTPLLTSHSSSAAVVEVVAGTVVGDVVGEVEVGTVVGAVVVGTVVVGTVVVGTVVGAVVVGTVVVGTVVGAVVVGTVVEVVAVVVGEVEVGTVVVGDSSSHSSGVNGLKQIVTPLLVEHSSSSATAAAANMTSPAAIRKRNADLHLRATNPFGNVHCQDSCGRTETVPTIEPELYRTRTDLAAIYALSSGFATATWSTLRSLRTSHVRPAFDEFPASWVAVVGRAADH